jgi:hypothetical protein
MNDLLRAIREVSHAYSLLIRVSHAQTRVIVAFPNPDAPLVCTEGTTTREAIDRAVQALGGMRDRL